MTEDTNALPAGADAGAPALEDVAEQTNTEATTEEAQADKADAEAENEDGEDDQPRRKSGSARLRARLDSEIAERARLEERLRIMQEQLAPRQEAPKQETPPREEDFNGDYFAYVRAAAAYDAKQEMRAEIDAIRRQSEQAKAQAEAHEVAQRYTAKENEFRKTISDYDEVVSGAIEDGLRLPPHVTETIAASDVGPALVYRLAKNPTEAARISSMPPLLAARELGRIEASISQNKPRTDSKAPPPIKPIAGRGGSQRALADVSFEEYRRIRSGG